MPVTIREARPQDAEAIAGIHVRAWQTTYRGQLSDVYLDGLRVEERLDMHRGALDGPPADYRMWVAEDSGRPVGFAVTGKSQDADAEGRTAELYAIYLEPDRMGSGVGRVLFQYAVDDLRERGFRSATLWVLATNERARRFYEIAGWTTDGTVTSERIDCEMRPTMRYRVDL